MMLWLRPEHILALTTSLFACSSLVSGKTYEKFWCATEEGHHQISCPDEKALLTDISIRKVHRRTHLCQPDDHSEYLVHCQNYLDGSMCEGNHTCSIDISSRDYIQCGEKSYVPTYFFVKYTCTQIHMMCKDTLPIRNTLYGYIVSSGYPYPMADNLKCSITIEADPSMFIELTPIEIQLQEALKCRSEYLEIFGYDSSSEETHPGRSKNTVWKSYHTWCGYDQSSNHPSSHARYLITSNSVYISLQTGVSKKERYFKIRYKIVPSYARSQYNSDGITYTAVEQGPGPRFSASASSTMFPSTTLTLPSSNGSELRNLSDTPKKSSFRKEILIAIICVALGLLLVIAIVVVTILLIRRFRRRSTSSLGKKSASASASSANPSSKPVGKSSDKAPLLDNNTNAASDSNKRKLVPERTVQVSDVKTSRFKANETSSKNASDPPSNRPTLTAADSGIYGADLSEEPPKPSKLTPVEVSKPPSPAPVTTATAVPDPVLIETSVPSAAAPTSEPISDPPVTTLSMIDHTIQSAYPAALIDATTSENEGTLCGSVGQSRRTSSIVPSDQELLEKKSDDLSSANSVAFNPLQVILKKDANKYYTTEYI